MPKTQTALNTELRLEWTEKIAAAIAAFEDVDPSDVYRVGSNVVAVPVLDSEQGEKWVEITVKVPTGSREDKEGYDGYTMATMYAEKVADNAKKKAEADAKKKAKIERDEARRAAAKKAREEHNAAK